MYNRPIFVAVSIGGTLSFLAFIWWWRRRYSDRLTRYTSEHELTDPATLLMDHLGNVHRNDYCSSSISKEVGIFLPDSNFLQQKRQHIRRGITDDRSIDMSSEISNSIDNFKNGLQVFDCVINFLENRINLIHDSTDKYITDDSNILRQPLKEVRSLLESAYILREQYKQRFINLCGIANINLSYQFDVSDDDIESFFSATEQIDYDELEAQLITNFGRPFYRSALKSLGDSEISFRNIRTQLVGCECDVEYLAKLICIRRGFAIVTSTKSTVDWLADISIQISRNLLVCLGYDTTEFEESFGRLLTYLKSCDMMCDNQLMDELSSKGIPKLNFYDIVFDKLLLDALQYLNDPPTSILVLTRNRWLSNSFKRSAIDSAVWTLITAKRQLLKYPNGFFAQYYGLVGTLAPALAWGFLGPDEAANSLCEKFREELLAFVRNLFMFSSNSHSKSVCSSSGSVVSLCDYHPSESAVLETDNVLDNKESDDESTLQSAELNGDERPLWEPTYSGLRYTTEEKLASDILKSLHTLSKDLQNILLLHSQINLTNHSNMKLLTTN